MECHARLLSDDPVDVDELGSQAHTRIASTICDLVDEEPAGKAVAIVGTWGSGKSTVVRLIERRWSGSDTRRVFSFDAWSHQGDSLRRSFIEELARDFAGNWVDEATANGAIDDITGRTDTVVSTSSPVLSWWGKLEALLIFLVPAGLVLLSGWMAARREGPRPPLDLWLTLGVVAVLAPIFVAILLGAWLWLRHGERKTKPTAARADRLDLLGMRNCQMLWIGDR